MVLALRPPSQIAHQHFGTTPLQCIVMPLQYWVEGVVVPASSTSTTDCGYAGTDFGIGGTRI
eukprot:364016-Rhodomonas_salina.1